MLQQAIWPKSPLGQTYVGICIISQLQSFRFLSIKITSKYFRISYYKYDGTNFYMDGQCRITHIEIYR